MFVFAINNFHSFVPNPYPVQMTVPLTFLLDAVFAAFPSECQCLFINNCKTKCFYYEFTLSDVLGMLLCVQRMCSCGSLSEILQITHTIA